MRKIAQNGSKNNLKFSERINFRISFRILKLHFIVVPFFEPYLVQLKKLCFFSSYGTIDNWQILILSYILQNWLLQVKTSMDTGTLYKLTYFSYLWTYELYGAVYIYT
jgi:hypothetical protein